MMYFGASEAPIYNQQKKYNVTGDWNSGLVF